MRFPREIQVHGVQCWLEPFDHDPAPGEFLGERCGRRVYRLLMYDGSDAIMRNVRYDSLVIVVPRRELVEEFGMISKR